MLQVANYYQQAMWKLEHTYKKHFIIMNLCVYINKYE
jgi:hypothetical protein